MDDSTEILSEADIAELQKLQKDKAELKLRIKKLDEKKAAARPEIVQKVREDYENRLKAVEETIEQKSKSVLTELGRCEEERKSLLSKKSAIDDAIEEVALRYLVGEYAEDLSRSLEEAKNKELEEYVNKIKETQDKIVILNRLIKPDEPEPTFEELKVPMAKAKTAEAKVPDKKLTIEFPTDITPETATGVDEGKFLKCQNCGAQNRHDNWYCEKCGHELLKMH